MNLLRRAAAWLPALLIAFLLCEAVLRLLGLGLPEGQNAHHGTETQTEIHTPEGSYAVYQPNSRLYYTYPSNPHAYFDADNAVLGSINADGYRGPARPKQKEEGVIRVACAGDSFTLGYGLRDGDTLPEQTQTLLNLHPARYEVMNFGVSGATCKTSRLLYENKIRAYRPDIFVFTYTPRNNLELSGIEENIVGAPIALPAWLQHSRLVNFTVRLYDSRRTASRFVPALIRATQDGSPDIEAAKQEIRAMHAACKRDGVRFLLAIYPIIFQLDDNYPLRAYHDALARFAAAEGIPCADFLPGFRGLPHWKLRVHDTDPHPNLWAQHIAARQLADALLALRPPQNPDPQP